MPVLHLPLTIAVDLLLLAILTGAGMRLIRRLSLANAETRLLAGCCMGIFLFVCLFFTAPAWGFLNLKVFFPAVVVLALIGFQPLLDIGRSWSWARFKESLPSYREEPFQFVLCGLLAAA